jgi:hypothetical protein
MMEGPLHLPALDGDVRRASASLDATRAMLGDEGGREAVRRSDPFEGQRHVAAQSTYRALVELEPAAHEVPLRDALLRWIYELLQARVSLPLEIDEAAALHARDPRLPEGREGPPPTYADAFAAIVRAPSPVPAAEALARAAELAPKVAAVRAERHARRVEVARRLGLAHPDALVSEGDVLAAARAWLDETEALAKERWTAVQRSASGPPDASRAIHAALAREAREGWPSRLNARWLSESFAALTVREIPAPPIPEALGGGSFLRAAWAYGRAVRAGGVFPSSPLVLARDPYPVGEHRFGFALACAVASPVFQRKVLGVSARTADAQARHLRSAMFDGARLLAARVVLARDRSPDTFEETCLRLFGAALPPGMRGAWPSLREDDAARAVALFATAQFVGDLVNRFDDDWFRNPRCGVHLAQIAAGPVFESLPLDPPAPAARWFEEAIG